MNSYLGNYALENDENTWFQNVKAISGEFGFCGDNKLYKQDPSAYVGNVNDACEILRVTLVGRKVTPNLFAIMKILGEEEITRRIKLVLNTL